MSGITDYIISLLIMIGFYFFIKNYERKSPGSKFGGIKIERFKTLILVAICINAILIIASFIS